MAKDRIYRVDANLERLHLDSEHAHRLVKGPTPAAVFKHITEGLFVVTAATPDDVAELMSKKVAVESAKAEE